ncbi:MAG TPA: DUF2561 family protein [Mycobacterium sp.]|jgi:hypothetical protein
MDRSHGLGRILLLACALVWLAVIAMSVAAIVALVGLGSGRAGEASADSSTPWGLYTIIGISAVVIIAAVPLLLRARRTAVPDVVPVQPPAAAVRGEAPTEKLRVFGSVAESPQPQRHPDLAPSSQAVDAAVMRFCAALATAMGAATLAIAVATYCMAEGADGGAWAALIIAAVITAAMPVIPRGLSRSRPATR